MNTDSTTDPQDVSDVETPNSANSLASKALDTHLRPRRKASYEASDEVQRWLRDQTAERADIKPPFTPNVLAHQRDRLWVLSSLERFYEDDLIADVLSMVKSGKEATVYCCAGGSATEREYVAAKVYRPRMFRSLQNDALYRESRAQRDTEGRGVRNDRRWRAHQRSSRGQQERVATWISARVPDAAAALRSRSGRATATSRRSATPC